ncbi:MAG: hypothetical protein HYU87_10495 [Chloroflexi bacterium]|nr:hypothetical protein [Chloroflexota bacterium]
MKRHDRPSEPAFRFEPEPILRILATHDVRFVVIGGLAGNIHGSTTITRDLDICYERTPENMERLANALRELRVTQRGADPKLPFRIDTRTIRNGLNFTFDTLHGWFDCLGDASGYGYAVLAPNAEAGEIGEVKVLIASLDDLIRMKRAAGRLKDLVEIEDLSKLRDVREERGLYGLAEPAAGPRRSLVRQRRRSTRARA